MSMLESHLEGKTKANAKPEANAQPPANAQSPQNGLWERRGVTAQRVLENELYQSTPPSVRPVRPLTDSPLSTPGAVPKRNKARRGSTLPGTTAALANFAIAAKVKDEVADTPKKGWYSNTTKEFKRDQLASCLLSFQCINGHSFHCLSM